MNDTSCRRLAGEVCIVTGGGGAVGRPIAKRLAAEGARVVVLDSAVGEGRDAERAIEAADSPGEAKFVRASVTDEAAVKGIMHAVEAEWGGIDGLVNAAAEPAAGSLLELSEDAWDRAVGARLRGAFFCTKHAAPILADGGGAIVNVAAAPGSDSASDAAFETAERGLRGLTGRSAIELASADVRVNGVELSKRRATAGREAGDDGTGRATGDAVDCGAATVAYLLSEDAAFVTGATVPVDGGAAVGTPESG